VGGGSCGRRGRGADPSRRQARLFPLRPPRAPHRVRAALPPAVVALHRAGPVLPRAGPARPRVLRAQRPPPRDPARYPSARPLPGQLHLPHAPPQFLSAGQRHAPRPLRRRPLRRPRRLGGKGPRRQCRREDRWVLTHPRALRSVAFQGLPTWRLAPCSARGRSRDWSAGLSPGRGALCAKHNEKTDDYDAFFPLHHQRSLKFITLLLEMLDLLHVFALFDRLCAENDSVDIQSKDIPLALFKSRSRMAIWRSDCSSSVHKQRLLWRHAKHGRPRVRF